MTTPDALVGAIRSALVALGDPARADPMQRYMKSALPFHGIQSPELRRGLRDWGNEFPRERVKPGVALRASRGLGVLGVSFC